MLFLIVIALIVGLVAGILIERNNSKRIEDAINKAVSVKDTIKADAQKVDNAVKTVAADVKADVDKIKNLY